MKAAIKEEWGKQTQTLIQDIFNGKLTDDPQLLAKAQAYAEHLGIKIPSLYVTEEFPPMFGGKMPNAMAIPTITHDIPGAVVFTKKMFTLHNYNLNGGAPVPNEVLWTLGHEMGHLKQGAAYMIAIRKCPQLVGMVGAVAGVYLLDKALERAKKEHKDNNISDESLQSALAAVAQEEQGKTKKWVNQFSTSQTPQGPLGVIGSTFHAALKAGEYVAAAGIGNVGGLFVTRELMLHTEFEADKMGAQLCGDPRAGIRALRSMREYANTITSQEITDLSRKITPKQVLSAYFEHAHPTYEERIARLEEMAKRMESGTASSIKATQTTIGAVLEHAKPLLSRLGESAIRLHIH